MTIKKERIELAALVAEIVGAIAVVISVVYLAFQIAESNKELRSQTHVNALTLGQRPVEIELEDAELASIVRRGYLNPVELSEDEWYRFTQYQMLALNAWEYYYYESGKETLPNELWIGANAYYEVHMQTKPGLRRFWLEYGHIYADPFHSYVDDIIRSAGPLN